VIPAAPRPPRRAAPAAGSAACSGGEAAEASGPAARLRPPETSSRAAGKGGRAVDGRATVRASGNEGLQGPPTAQICMYEKRMDQKARPPGCLHGPPGSGRAPRAERAHARAGAAGRPGEEGEGAAHGGRGGTRREQQEGEERPARTDEHGGQRALSRTRAGASEWRQKVAGRCLLTTSSGAPAPACWAPRPWGTGPRTPRRTRRAGRARGTPSAAAPRGTCLAAAGGS